MLQTLGCPTEVERGNRVFPKSQKASDVTRVFQKAIEALGVTVRLNARVQALQAAGGAVSGVELESGEVIPAQAAIVCTGGVSYPSTGSTGDGYTLLHRLGHKIIPAKPSLCGLISEDAWIRAFAGAVAQERAADRDRW